MCITERVPRSFKWYFCQYIYICYDAKSVQVIEIQICLPCSSSVFVNSSFSAIPCSFQPVVKLSLSCGSAYQRDVSLHLHYMKSDPTGGGCNYGWTADFRFKLQAESGHAQNLYIVLMLFSPSCQAVPVIYLTCCVDTISASPVRKEIHVWRCTCYFCISTSILSKLWTSISDLSVWIWVCLFS